MPSVTNKQMKELIIEALDFNATTIALCTAWFGNTERNKDSKRFVKSFESIRDKTISRREEILGIKKENL